MSKEDFRERTVIDERRRPIRLKQGIIPDTTGIYLKIEHGPDAGAMADLSAGGVYVIGRDDADLAVHDGKVSRRHAEIGLYGPGAFIVRDLASTNGTRVNGKPVSDRQKLRNGDLIEVGDTGIRFTVIEGGIRVS
ncbi:MAG: FHA domain-containing protein [Acidobacteriota bacterium]|nr:FHA domain-containing protein [Acidobacteriota bacterium]